MCGITGQLRLDRRRVDRDLVTRMTRRLAHRGPDGEGYHIGRRIGLGHRRLAVIDAAGGVQPMADRDRALMLVANNEIYNYRELRTSLESRGCRFRTRSDTEVILQAVALDGLGGVRTLEGMFAFAVWDDRNETLLLARDRFGVKPLYYYQDADVFLFASELAAFFEYRGLRMELNPHALDQYFGSLAIPEPDSVLAHVHKVPPGHCLTMSGGRVRMERYWRPPLSSRSKLHPRSVAVAGAGLMRELERSVSFSLRSDVPVGVLLSGGLDSSSVAVVASRVGGQALPTFSAVFNEADFDERGYARQVAQLCGGRSREVLVTRRRATRIAELLARTIDEPFADASAIPTYAVCELAAAHVKVVLSGEGADELLAGYPWHVTRPIDRTNDVGSYKHPGRAVFLGDERRALYGPAWTTAREARRRNAVAARRTGASPLHSRLLDDLRTYLPSDILFKSDRMSMQHSLELRVPFLNHGLAEYLLRLPDAMKVRGRVRKFLLRHIMAGVLPAAVLQRPKKGFSIPLDLWLWQRGDWRDMIYDTVFSRRVRERGQFNMLALEALRQQHERLERAHGYKLWTVFMFEMWQRSFLDRAPAGGAS